MGRPPDHIYYGSDPGDKDERFSSGSKRERDDLRDEPLGWFKTALSILLALVLTVVIIAVVGGIFIGLFYLVANS